MHIVLVLYQLSRWRFSKIYNIGMFNIIYLYGKIMLGFLPVSLSKALMSVVDPSADIAVTNTS